MCNVRYGTDVSQLGESRQANFLHNGKSGEKVNIGERLLESFLESCETDDKKIIAEKLGYEDFRSVYKILSGERELDYEKLMRFAEATNFSIHWLLTGNGSKYVEAMGGKDTSPMKPDELMKALKFEGVQVIFIKGLMDYEKKSFADILCELVYAGMDERAKSLASAYRQIDAPQFEEVLTMYLKNLPAKAEERARSRKNDR